MKQTLFAAVALAVLWFPLGAGAQESGGSLEQFSMEVRAPFSYKLPTDEPSALAYGAEIYYYVTPQVHSDKYRSFFAEEASANRSMYHLAGYYEPRSDLRTSTRGYTVVAEAVRSLGGKFGVGGFVRYSTSDLRLEQPTSDYEFGPQISYWSTRRTYVNEKLTYRSISGELNPLNPFNNPLIDPNPVHPNVIERDQYLQLAHHISYLIGEDWGFTYAHDLRVLIGILGTPHANNLSFYNYFMFSPSARYSLGPVVGVNLDYFVGRATSSLSIPLGARLELFTGPIAAEVEGSYTISTIEGQPTPGWLVRGVVGYRF